MGRKERQNQEVYIWIARIGGPQRRKSDEEPSRVTDTLLVKKRKGKRRQLIFGAHAYKIEGSPLCLRNPEELILRN